jgi:hypothetical protein
VRITAVRLFRVEGRGPAWTFEDRAVEQLDLFADHMSSTAGAADVGTHLAAWYVSIETDGGPSGLYGPIDRRQAFLVATELRPHLLGVDPLATEALHDRMLRVHRHGPRRALRERGERRRQRAVGPARQGGGRAGLPPPRRADA